MIRWTSLLMAALLLAVMIPVGCASPARPSRSVSGSPPSPPQRPAEELLSQVPRHPLTTSHVVLPDQRASIRVDGERAAEVLAWYQKVMPAGGWKAESTGLPAEMVLLFSKEGRFLSIAGHDAMQNQSSVIWFHQRPTREVTRDQAVAIARNTHQVEAEWTATLIPDLEMPRFGAGARHPVWMVEALPGNDAVWVDAITAEPFQVRQ